MSAQHTPGPWGIEQTGQTLWVGPMQPNAAKVDHVVVSLSFDNELTHAAKVRQLDNAQVIAAAPELLDALDELQSSIERRWLGETDRKRANAVSPRTEEALVAARAAIAKARGEA